MLSLSALAHSPLDPKNYLCSLLKSSAKGMLARASVRQALQEKSQCSNLPSCSHAYPGSVDTLVLYPPNDV